RDTIFRFPIRRRGLVERLAFGTVVWMNPRSGDVPLMLEKVMWDRTFGGRMLGGRRADRAAAIECFHRHIDEVKAHVSGERLLVFDVAEGWSPLCEFLDVAVPAEPFPRINDTTAFRRMLAARRRAAVFPWLKVPPWRPPS